MARGKAPQPPLESRPYPSAKVQVSEETLCELCNRTFKTRDWVAHKNSKKHRQLEEKEREPQNGTSLTVPFDNITNGANGNGSQDAGRRSSADASGWGGDTGGFDTASGFAANDDFGTSTNDLNLRGGGGGACYGCGEQGHNKRDCPKSSGGRGACFNCDEVGHNKADCPHPPRARGGGGGGGGGGGRACFICGGDDHIKADCPNRGTGGGGGGGSSQECHNCFQTGHRKADCLNERVMKCRNCDGIGHMSKECPKPRDYSRIQCNNCKKYGHTIKRCDQPIVESVDGGGGWNNGGDSGASGNWANNDSTSAAPNGWEDSEPAAGGDGYGGSWDNAPAGNSTW
ncbi:hypothetical protein BS50DRAFT_634102 [Corynespora cassiicola Philippines]|uniref:CCHC-type domain-containing protein n=1 Tax=Corynespora cassiicola Philippines TaxID=1448308 RepID=A0A2T2NMU2_CORCC|nr:hypothetical protein BS50DRAFT_634102 [Corynespora cassiicola Philippines]